MSFNKQSETSTKKMQQVTNKLVERFIEFVGDGFESRGRLIVDEGLLLKPYRCFLFEGVFENSPTLNHLDDTVYVLNS